MDTPMMTATRKSFFASLTFHALMGSLAFFVLVKMHTPPPKMKIETKHIMILSLADSAPKPRHQEIQDLPAQVTPTTPPKPQPIVPKPIIPIKAQLPQPTSAQPAVVTAPPTPILSTPTLLQRSVQNAPAAEVVHTPPKPKIDLAAEKRSFYAQLRTKIQSNLRYPTAARRRGMEGEVDIRFILSSNGEINGISVQRGEGIFHNSAIAAVNAASGINIPKSLSDSMPLEIDLTLEFNLKS
jgi:periplasmic protein TonB